MGFGASSFGFRIQGFGLQVSGSRVSDSEYRVEVSRVFDALKRVAARPGRVPCFMFRFQFRSLRIQE